tara:strand:- start:965 stop:1162 length:198 start_codon:yes stop_codon:yes gene_type:complete
MNLFILCFICSILCAGIFGVHAFTYTYYGSNPEAELATLMIKVLFLMLSIVTGISSILFLKGILK